MKTIIRKLILSALLAITSLNFATNLYGMKNQRVIEPKKNKGPKRAKKFFTKHAANPNEIREFLNNKSNRKNFTLIDNGKFIVETFNSCIEKENYALLKVLFAIPVVRETIFKFSQKQVFKPLYIENDRVYYMRIPTELPIGFQIGFYAARLLDLAIKNDDHAMVKDLLGFTAFRDALPSYGDGFLVRLILQAAKNNLTKIVQLLVDDEKLSEAFFLQIKKSNTQTLAKILCLFARNGTITGIKKLLSDQNILSDLAAYDQGLPIVQAVYTATANGHTNTVEYLMDNQELVKIFVTYNGNCDFACEAVQTASEIGCLPIVELLLKNSTIAANFFTTDKKKQHFFDDAIKIATTNGHTAVVDYLKIHGNTTQSLVQPNVPTQINKTPEEETIPVNDKFSFDSPQYVPEKSSFETPNQRLDTPFIIGVKKKKRKPKINNMNNTMENQTQTKIPQDLEPVQISFSQKLKVLLKKVIESKYCKYGLTTSILILIAFTGYSCMNSLSQSLTQNTIIQNFAKCSSMAGCDSAAIACTFAKLENECQAAFDLINQE